MVVVPPVIDSGPVSSVIVRGVLKTDGSKTMVLLPGDESACWMAHRRVLATLLSVALLTVNCERSRRSSKSSRTGLNPRRSLA